MYELYQFLAIFFFIWFILFFISLFNYKVRQKVFMGYSRKKNNCDLFYRLFYFT